MSKWIIRAFHSSYHPPEGQMWKTVLKHSEDMTTCHIHLIAYIAHKTVVEVLSGHWALDSAHI